MNEISDKEISDRYLRMINTIHSIPEVTKNLPEFKQTRRDYLFYKLLNGWNLERAKAGFKPLSTKRLASAINSNPFLKDDDGELELLIKECEQKGNYKKAHFILFGKKKTK